MVKILREADQSPVTEGAKKQGVSDVTIYAWRKRFFFQVDVKRDNGVLLIVSKSLASTIYFLAAVAATLAWVIIVNSDSAL